MLDRLQKIIVVKGVSNSGKSSSIRDAMKKLGVHVAPDDKGDKLIACYPFSAGRFVGAGIASGGDTEEIVRGNIAFFDAVELQISVVVMATKSRGKSFQAALSFANAHGIDPIILETQYSRRNAAQANSKLGDEICMAIF